MVKWKIGADGRHTKVGRKVVYQIYKDDYDNIIMQVQRKANYEGRAGRRFGRAYAVIRKEEFLQLTAREKIKIFSTLHLDAVYEASDMYNVMYGVDVTHDRVRMLWLNVGVIKEFDRNKEAA